MSLQNTDHEREQLEQQRQTLIEAYQTLNGELTDLSWTLAELEQQIAQLQAELATRPAPEPERRLRDLGRWRSTLEERVLELMYRADTLAATLKQVLAQLEDEH
ncbi:MAG: hypothetical protein AB4911_10145 [Oscillochloridaceae bacterium umkhey_bin13]